MANEYAVNRADLTAVADAIRSKGSTTDELAFPGGFVAAVEAIQAGGGGDSQLVALLADQLEELNDSSITELSVSAIRQRSKLKKIHLPNCVKVDDNSFSSCKNLTELSLPAYTGKLSNGNLNSTAMNCANGCTSLETVNMPNVTFLASSFFQDCIALKRVHFPKLEGLNGSAFQNAGLEEFVCPTLVTGQNRMFYNCSSLTKVDITYSSWKIESHVFYGCTALTTFILRATSLRSLDNINAFYNTPIANGTGYIYVPAALVDTYKEATNWTTFADQFRAIEDYPEITGG